MRMKHKIHGRERRFEGRCLCAQLVRVDAPGGKIEAVLEDISALGGCVQVEEPIPLGSAVVVMIGNSAFHGHVCYCVYRDYGYFAGIRFAEDTVWSRDQVAPQHLTDLRALALHAGAEVVTKQ
jgi:hypothetical protein